MSTSFPAHAVFRVFERDAALRQFVADFICAGKVATAARFLTLVNQGLNRIIEHDGLFVLEDAQHRVEAVEQGEQFMLVIFAQGVFVNRRVDFAGEVMQGGQRDRSIEVVVETCLEIFEGAQQPLPVISGLSPARRALLSAASEKRASP